MEQTAEVAFYFDGISTDYRSRYSDKNPFHNFFFCQRLKAATGGFSFNGKSVLDIGAGTGALYDELRNRFPAVDYFGCDISRQMLAQSSIPCDRAFVGQIHEISPPRDRFDFIFSLGVTTYQTPEELARTLRLMSQRLSPNGTAIISFTNRASIDNLLRRAMKLAKPIVRRGIFCQPFDTYAYRSNEVEQMARRAGLRVIRSIYLNQTFSPFNTLLPKPSIALAGLIEQCAPAAMIPALSSDFIVFAEPD